MKMLWRLSREAIRYKTLYVIAILSTLALTGINLAAPKVLSALTGIVERGVDEAGLGRIGVLTAVLLGLYLLRVLFRFLSSYLSHKAAWYLVGDLRTKVYDKLERMHLGYFHDKQTGDLMSRVVNDTRDFELLYAHMIPESITNLLSGWLRRPHGLPGRPVRGGYCGLPPLPEPLLRAGDGARQPAGGHAAVPGRGGAGPGGTGRSLRD